MMEQGPILNAHNKEEFADVLANADDIRLVLGQCSEIAV